MNRKVFAPLAAAVLAGAWLAGTGPASAQDVKIGVLYALTGPQGQIGLDSVAAVRTAMEIVNEGLDLPLRLAGNKGLRGLKGGKVSIVVSDHQGKPEIGQGDAERLINQDKVHALFGAYFSSVTATASQVAERAGIPMVCGTSTSPALNRRGFKYFFRTTPTDEHFGILMFDFMQAFMKRSNVKLETVAIFNEDTAFGSDAAKAQDALAKQRGFRVVDRISYRAQTTSLTSEIQRFKAANPDVLLPTSYTSDTFLTLRTAKDLDYNPKMLLANNAGYTDPTFLRTVGKDGEGVMSRSPYNEDLAGRIPLINRINEIFKKHSGGRDLTDIPVREFTGFMTLLDAIDRAGSLDPEKIREALVKTDIPASQLIVPFGGIKFGADGQNEKVQALIQQVQKGRYCTIYPFELASCPVQYPMPTWAEKAKM